MRPQTPEPLFGGTPVNLRLRQFGALGMPSLGANEVARWTNSIHSNAIPYLVKALDERDAPLRKAYQSLWRILPSWISNHFPPPIYAVKMRGAAVFGLSVIGQDARAAIPQLIRLWKEEKDMGVRILVLRCLARIGEQDNRVTSAMIDSLNDKDPQVRRKVVEVLAWPGREPADVVPALISSLRDEWSTVRYEAAHSLCVFSNAAYAAVPELLHALEDPVPFVRSEATNALKQIAPEAAAKAGTK